MAPKKKSEGSLLIKIPAPKRARMKVRIVGTSPLVVHRFGAKATRMIAEKQAKTKKAVASRTKRNPKEEYEDAMYKLPSNGKLRTGFPAACLKESIAVAAKRFYGIDKVQIYGCMWIHGERSEDQKVRVDGQTIVIGGKDCIEIKGKVKMRTDSVTLMGMNKPKDLRYRPEYSPWHADVEIEYDAERLEPETILRLLAEAGVKTGLCEHRVEKGGLWGTFSVDGKKSKAG